MTEPLKFRAPDGQTIRISILEGGHTAVITDEFRELPERFHRLAIAQGAITSAMQAPIAPPPADGTAGEDDHEALVKRALIQMLERSEDNDFTAAGQPDLRIVRGLAGVNADRDLIYSVFAKLKAEAGEQ